MNAAPLMTADDLNRFFESDFPQMHIDGRVMEVIAVEPGAATVRFGPLCRHVRPGGTLSGSALFTLADVSAYAVVLAHIGPKPLAVTTSLNINFLSKAKPGSILCTATLLKLGTRLAVVDLSIFLEGSSEQVAHALATYSIPPS